MDRDARREIRKRGAASRQLATSQEDVVIRTPKWVPVSRDSGALITEEMSLVHSPLYQRQYQAHEPHEPHETPTRTREFVDPALLQEHPRTPQQRIGYTYEPATNESNRSLVSSRPTPQKNRHRSVSREEVPVPVPVPGPSSLVDREVPKKRKPLQKKKQHQPQQSRQKSKKAKQKEPEEYDDTEHDNGYSSLDEFVLEEDSDDDKQPSIEISRLPTTSSRLTGIDVVMHYLKTQTPTSAVFDTFSDLNQEMFSEILDLNLVNNHYVYQLRDLKSDKQDLRRDVLQKRKQVSEQMAKLEKLRRDYNRVRTLLSAKWKIANKLKKAREAHTETHSPRVVEQLNRLNNVLDPQWSLVDKLKELNSRLYSLDKQLK